MMNATEMKPGIARTLWEKWKRLGKKIGDAQARLLLSFFYFVLLSPFALGMRWWSDPLAIKPHAAKGWRARENHEESARQGATRQF